MVVQLVRTPACHAGGREFESRPSRHFKEIRSAPAGFFFLHAKKKRVRGRRSRAKRSAVLGLSPPCPVVFFLKTAMRCPAENFSFPRRFLEALLDVVFPRECLVYGVSPEGSPYRFLSISAREEIDLIDDADSAVCPVCGALRPPARTASGECVFCAGRKFHFGCSRSALCFNAPVRSLVHAMKYEKIHAVVDDLVAIATESASFVRHLEGSTLVPVPLFLARLYRRGFNQSLLICEKLSKRVAGTQVAPVLVRIRDTGTQTKLSAEARARNVRGAFRVAEKFKKTISPRERYVVVDDVFTTGSTLSECARALQGAGARIVDAATLAHD